MRNKLTTLLAKILRRPVFWIMDHLVEHWRKNLPKYQARRAESDGSLYWSKVSENARKMVNLWDRVKHQRLRKINEAYAEAKAETDSIQAEIAAQQELGVEIDPVTVIKMQRMVSDLEKGITEFKGEFGFTAEDF